MTTRLPAHPQVRLPALRFEAEAFRLGTDKILGRQSAGDAFLRAVLALPGLEELIGCGPNPAAGKQMAAMAGGLPSRWLSTVDHAALAAQGAVHFPDPMIANQARARLAHGSAAYSLTGVTHTIASQGAMRGLADLAVAPLMEWDGVICTSDAVKASAAELLAAQADYLAWRFPGAAPLPLPQMPVIPLGVHCDDFRFTEEDREEARRALGLGAGEVAFLFVGRLSFHAKANPLPMYVALEQAVRRTGKRIALIQCGWFAHSSIEQTFKDSAAGLAPSVRHLWLDGRQSAQRARAWAAGDVFISLSDNIQETFGLTPLEAMAAGLPVLVSDWNGYRQTVRHGECGLMVPTQAPAPGAGEAYGAAHAAEAVNYDHYLAHTARHVAVDLAALCEAATVLAGDADKRRTMGEAGRAIARAEFDWAGVIGQYQAFWDELAAIRTALSADDPRRRAMPSADQLDPFRLFAGYPSKLIAPQSRLALFPGGEALLALSGHPMFDAGREQLPAPDRLAAMARAFGSGAAVEAAAAHAGLGPQEGVLWATFLLKLGVLAVAEA